MRSKSMTACADKMLVWIEKDTHQILKLDAAKTGMKISALADIAIKRYYQLTKKEDKK